MWNAAHVCVRVCVCVCVCACIWSAPLRPLLLPILLSPLLSPSPCSSRRSPSSSRPVHLAPCRSVLSCSLYRRPMYALARRPMYAASVLLFLPEDHQLQRPPALAWSCRGHGDAGRDSQKQRCTACGCSSSCCAACSTACGSKWRCCTACHAAPARADQKERTVRGMGRCCPTSPS